MSDILSDNNMVPKEKTDRKNSWLIDNDNKDLLFQSAKGIKEVLNNYDIKPTYFRITKKHLKSHKSYLNSINPKLLCHS